MYHVSAQGVDERMINVHYYYCKHRFEVPICSAHPSGLAAKCLLILYLQY